MKKCQNAVEKMNYREKISRTSDKNLNMIPKSLPKKTKSRKNRSKWNRMDVNEESSDDSLSEEEKNKPSSSEIEETTAISTSVFKKTEPVRKTREETLRKEEAKAMNKQTSLKKMNIDEELGKKKDVPDDLLSLRAPNNCMKMFDPGFFFANLKSCQEKSIQKQMMRCTKNVHNVGKTGNPNENPQTNQKKIKTTSLERNVIPSAAQFCPSRKSSQASSSCSSLLHHFPSSANISKSSVSFHLPSSCEKAISAAQNSLFRFSAATGKNQVVPNVSQAVTKPKGSDICIKYLYQDCQEMKCSLKHFPLNTVLGRLKCQEIRFVFEKALEKKNSTIPCRIIQLQKIRNIDFEKNLLSYLLKYLMKHEIHKTFQLVPQMQRLKFLPYLQVNSMLCVSWKLEEQQLINFIAYLDDNLEIRPSNETVQALIPKLMECNKKLALWKLLEYSLKLVGIKVPAIVVAQAIETLNDDPSNVDISLKLVLKMSKDQLEAMTSNSLSTLMNTLKRLSKLNDAECLKFHLQRLVPNSMFHMLEKRKTTNSQYISNRQEDLWNRFSNVNHLDDLYIKQVCASVWPDQFQKFCIYVFTIVRVNLSEVKKYISQVGVCTLLECYKQKKLKEGYQVLRTMHEFEVNYLELQNTSERSGYELGIISPVQIAMTAIDICISLNYVGDAFTILKDLEWPQTCCDNDKEILFKIRTMKRLFEISFGLKDFEMSRTVFYLLLGSFAADKKVLKATYHTELSPEKLYNSVIKLALELGEVKSAAEVYAHINYRFAVLTLEDNVLRMLLIHLVRADIFNEIVSKLYKLGLTHKIYSCEQMENGCMRIRTYFLKEEIKLILTNYLINFKSKNHCSFAIENRSFIIYLDSGQQQHSIPPMLKVSQQLEDAIERVKSVLSEMDPPLQCQWQSDRRLCVFVPTSNEIF